MGFLAVSQKLLMETLGVLACNYVNQEHCFFFFLDFCCGVCQHHGLRCDAVIADLTLQAWKQCDWLRKRVHQPSSISVLCLGLSLCLGSSLKAVLGVCMLQKHLQHQTCPFTICVGQQKPMLVFMCCWFQKCLSLQSPITTVVPSCGCSAPCYVRGGREGCLCAWEAHWEVSGQCVQDSIAGTRMEHSCLMPFPP